MLTSEEILDYMRQESYRPLSYHELAATFKIQEQDQVQFAKLMGRLQKDGEILRTRKDKYGVPEK